MEVKEAIQTRRSVRAYQDKEIPEEKIKKVLEAARSAPSANNRQPWKFIVVKDPKNREKLTRATADQSFVGEAPVIIVAVALQPEYIMRCDVPGYPVDLAIAVDHMTLLAVDEGLGTCWIGAFYQDEVRKILNIPEKYKVVALLPLGFPADKQGNKFRKPLEEMVCYESFV